MVLFSEALKAETKVILSHLSIVCGWAYTGSLFYAPPHIIQCMIQVGYFDSVGPGIDPSKLIYSIVEPFGAGFPFLIDPLNNCMYGGCVLLFFFSFTLLS